MPPYRVVLRSMLVVCLVAACSNVRHPLDDSETRPETEAMAVEEAEETLDDIGEAVFGGRAFTDDTWSPEDGCGTAPFAPSQGEVGLVLIRAYDGTAVGGAGSPEGLLDDYERFWVDLGESATRSSPNMEPGVVSRVNGVGYELVSLPPAMELRAYIPCY